MTDKRTKDDMAELLRRSDFARFLFRVIQMAGILSPATDGSESGALSREARRNLGLEILALVDSGQPAEHPESIPILTLIQVLREEAQDKKEKPNGEKYDRNAELDVDDDG